MLWFILSLSCSDSCDAVSASCVAGDYELQTVDDKPLPATIGVNGQSTYSAGHLILRTDGMYTWVLTSSYCNAVSGLGAECPQPLVTVTNSGTWIQIAGDSLGLNGTASVPVAHGVVFKVAPSHLFTVGAFDAQLDYARQ